MAEIASHGRTFKEIMCDPIALKRIPQSATLANMQRVVQEAVCGRACHRRKNGKKCGDPKKPEFIVYMPKRIGKHKNKVVTRFSLPSGHIRFDFSDEHYQT